MQQRPKIVDPLVSARGDTRGWSIRSRRAAIQNLAVRPAATRIVPSPLDISENDEHVKLRFAREVLERLDGPVLRYSMRLELHGIARRLGIARFDANLIIAQVQHRAGGGVSDETDDDDDDDELRGSSCISGVLLVVVIETLVVASGWAVFC
jgi:hypothetical protein